MEQLLAEDCPKCPRGAKLSDEPRLVRLQHYVTLLDAGCPVGRHELSDHDWTGVAAIRAEREKLNAPQPEDFGWKKVPEGKKNQ